MARPSLLCSLPGSIGLWKPIREARRLLYSDAESEQRHDPAPPAAAADATAEESAPAAAPPDAPQLLVLHSIVNALEALGWPRHGIAAAATENRANVC